tara:strand:- start:589 stop:762 length:174 start_codon:yes stop_codon:yes gene_type:complete
VLRFTLKEIGFTLGLLMRLSSELQLCKTTPKAKKQSSNLARKKKLGFINLEKFRSNN